MKRYLLAAIAAISIGAAAADDPGKFTWNTTGPVPILSINSGLPRHLAIHGNGGKTIIDVNLDTGEVKHEGYDPDEAARAFWEAVGKLRPDCVQR
jgi:hypothetical protein